MKQILENESIRIAVEDSGAELCSIYDKEKEREVLWQADPAYWKRHAPVLFPNVGRHYQDSYRVNGKEYPSKQHGFARDMAFTCFQAGENSVTHQLVSSEITREKYPFDFQLLIAHTLCERKLTIHWKVVNTGKGTMYFTIGGHPAFRVPVLPDTKQSDYRLTFDGQEALTYLLLDAASGTAQAQTSYTLELEKGSCPIKEHMFDKDALVFDNGQITKAGITLPDGSPYVTVVCDGFPNFGIWAAPNAPFVCLEPWMGRCDNCGYEGELSQKPGIQTLAAGEIFEKSYDIEIF